MRKKISKETKNLVVDLYVETNLKVCEIGALANVSSSTIHKILNERNIPKRKELYNVSLAIDMYEQGYPLCEIYPITNISQDFLYKELDKRNVPRRKNSSLRHRPTFGSKYTNAILKLHKEGKSKGQIARELMISYNTVGRILSKEIKAS